LIQQNNSGSNKYELIYHFIFQIINENIAQSDPLGMIQEDFDFVILTG